LPSPAAAKLTKKDFEPSEAEIQNALTLLTDAYTGQASTLCECFFADFGYDDASTCESDRVITADESSCIYDAFVLDRGSAGDWLTCQINNQRA
jgi:hypothetical protein